MPESEDALDAEVEAAGRQMAAGPTGLSSEQKRKVNMVHVNLGHISRQQMLSLSLFKAAGANDEDMRFVRDEYQCDHCMKQRKPVDRKKATMPRTLAFNRIVAVDT